MTYPNILWHPTAMRMDPITSTPSYSAPVPAFTFLFASNEAKPAKRTKSSWLTRPALRSKRV